MTQIVSRSDIREALAAWSRGEVLPHQLHAWAEDRFANPDFETEDEITNEVLGALDMLDLNLIIPADIPVYLAVLELPVGSIAVAVQMLERYEKAIDYPARMDSLREDPFYSRGFGAR